MKGPFDGIRVVDLTSMVSGPVSTMMLADQGAEVIKVEPMHGEQMRYIGPNKNGVTAGFFSCNRGKRSLAVDLKKPEGIELVKDLIKTADVFVQNFRPGAIDRMGLGESVARALKPDIVYVSISGFGEKGPYAHKRVYDPVIQALSGAADVQADRVTKEPAMFRVIIADKVTAVTAAQAMSAALFARERTGEGQHVQLSMLDTMVAFFWPENFSTLTFVGEEKDPSTFQTGLDLIYKTQDGYITAGAISDDEWRGMCAALNKPEWQNDERFATSTARFQNVKVRKELTAIEIAKWSSAEILDRLDKESVPSAPILSRAELIDDVQIVENDTLVIGEFGDLGQVRQARPAARMEKTPAEIRGAAPKLGEHTEAILSDLGYDADKIGALGQDGIVSTT